MAVEDVEVIMRDFGRLLLIECSCLVDLSVDDFISFDFVGFCAAASVFIGTLLLAAVSVLGGVTSVCFRSMGGCCFKVFAVANFVVIATAVATALLS